MNENGIGNKDEDVYWVIHNGEGDTDVVQYTRKEVLELIQTEIDCDREIEDSFFKTTPEDSDTNYWGGKYLIIKGNIVSPIPKEKVTHFEVE